MWPGFIGKAWTSDYGDPDVPGDFDFIYPLSPVHNVPKDKVLPPTLLLTADRKHSPKSRSLCVIYSSISVDDDRVVPMHSFKLAATLQYTLPQNPHPLLLRVDKKAGHGAGKSTEKRYLIIAIGRLQVLMRITTQDSRVCR